MDWDEKLLLIYMRLFELQYMSFPIHRLSVPIGLNSCRILLRQSKPIVPLRHVVKNCYLLDVLRKEMSRELPKDAAVLEGMRASPLKKKKKRKIAEVHLPL